MEQADQSVDEAHPAAVSTLFGDCADLAHAYARHLATTGVSHGLIGPREVPRLWDRHLLNCAAVAPAIPAGATVADIGSGAGLPGLVLAIARPDLRVTLIEPLDRRTRWLDSVVSDLGLSVEVRQAKAEACWGDVVVDVVTARAVASLGELARLSLPLVSVGGRVVALKGDRAADELTTAASLLDQLGATDCRVQTFGEGVVDSPATAVLLTASRPAPRWRDPVGDGPARTAARQKERQKERRKARAATRRHDQGG